MSNRELEFVLKLRDEATANFNKFKNEVGAGSKSISNMFGGLKGIIAGAFTVGAVMNFVEASNEAEKSAVKLRQALANQGDSSEATFKSMEAFSRQIQKTTIYDDDLVTSIQATFVAMTGLTGRAVEPLTKAALDLASGLGMDAQSAALLISKTVEGADALGRYGIKIGETHSEGERLEKIVAEINKRFGDLANKEGASAYGRLQQVKNAFGDLKETIGDVIKTAIAPVAPEIIMMIQKIGQLFTFIIQEVKAFSFSGANMILTLISPIITLLNAVGMVTDKTVEQFDIAIMKLREWRDGAHTAANDTAAAFLDFSGSTAASMDVAGNSVANFSTVAGSSGKSVSALKKEIEDLKKATDELAPGTKERIAGLTELAILERDLAAAIDAEAASVANATRIKSSFDISLSLDFIKRMRESLDGFKNSASGVDTAIKLTLPVEPEIDLNGFREALSSIDEMERRAYSMGKNEDLIVLNEWFAKVKKTHGLTYKELARAEKLYAQQSGIIFEQEHQRRMQQWIAEHQYIVGPIQSAFATVADALKGQTVTLNDLWQGVKNSVIDALVQMAAQQLINAIAATATLAATTAAMATAMSTITAFAGPAATLVSIASFGAAAVAGEAAVISALAATKMASLFHDGGTMGASGQRIALASDDRPAILRVGETVRTREQEQALQSSRGTVVNLNFYSAVPATEWIKQQVEKGMRAAGLTDSTEFFVNQRAQVSL